MNNYKQIITCENCKSEFKKLKSLKNKNLCWRCRSKHTVIPSTLKMPTKEDLEKVLKKPRVVRKNSRQGIIRVPPFLIGELVTINIFEKVGQEVQNEEIRS